MAVGEMTGGKVLGTVLSQDRTALVSVIFEKRENGKTGTPLSVRPSSISHNVGGFLAGQVCEALLDLEHKATEHAALHL